MMKAKLKYVARNKNWLLVLESGKNMQVARRELSLALYPLGPEKHDGLEVECELENGQPAKIRELGTKWQPQPPDPPARRPENRKGGGRRAPHTERRPSAPSRQRPSGPFHNPYNFIPAPPRNPKDPELGDCKPPGHDRYQPNLWTGRIAVRLTTQTPLLVHDAGKMELYKDDPIVNHKIFPARLDAEGRPYLSPTSVKGMLRSAFEAATNSRFGVFEKHQDRLAYRMEAKGGPVPARVEKRNGREGLRIMDAPVLGAAAKLPRYEEFSDRRDKGAGKKHVSRKYPDGALPQHGDAVWVQLDKNQVTNVERRTNGPSPSGNWRAGWACVTGPNINKKRFERIFLEGPNDDFVVINDELRSLWRELVNDYQETHERELEQRRLRRQQPHDYLGDKPGETGWSRHIYTKNEVELREGTLCYVEFADKSRKKIIALVPVTISRRLYSVSPNELLDNSLKPAKQISELSPADRVFGWVRQNNSNAKKKETSKTHAAYKGNLRIGPTRCVTPEPLKLFDYPGLPLAILGQPKPQQARFYVAATKQGEAQPIDISKKQAGYFADKGLRGRKVYPHHRGLPETYWENPLVDNTQFENNGFFQEYRRPKGPKERDDQNRSITSWVRPQVTFDFEIDITNLSSVELGALLWLLRLPADHFFRLGGGKPLGFGSVQLTVTWKDTSLYKGDWWRNSYLKLEASSQSDADNTIPTQLQGCIGQFKQSVVDAYPAKCFEQVSFIDAFMRGAQGFTDCKPLHYPRAFASRPPPSGTIPPHTDGKGYEWFVANERQSGPKLSLPDLVNDDGLPLLPANPPEGGNK